MILPHNHNGGPSLIEDDEDRPRMMYARIHVSDLLNGIRTLSMEERGFYLSAMFNMYDLMGELPEDDRKAAMIIGCEIRMYRRLKERLIEIGKLSRDEQNRIYNDRVQREISAYCQEYKNRRQAALEREEKKRLKGSVVDEMRPTSGQLPLNFSRTSGQSSGEVAGTSPGSPGEVYQQVSKKTNEINDTPTTTGPEASGNLWSYARALPKPKLLSKDPQSPPQGGVDLDDQFEVWWSSFPPSVRKHGKGECRQLFRQVVTGYRIPGKRGQQKILDHGTATAEQLIDAVRRYAATSPNPEFVPAPATWFNQGRWLDAPTPAEPHAAHQTGVKKPAPFWWRGQEDRARGLPIEVWTKAVTAHANGIWPEETLGPPPGNEGCLVPRDLVVAMRLDQIYTPNGTKR